MTNAQDTVERDSVGVDPYRLVDLLDRLHTVVRPRFSQILADIRWV